MESVEEASRSIIPDEQPQHRQWLRLTIRSYGRISPSWTLKFAGREIKLIADNKGDLLPIKFMKIADLQDLFSFNARIAGDGFLMTERQR